MWIVKIAPTSLFTPETPTLQLGMEFMPAFTGRFSLAADYGIPTTVGKDENNKFDRLYDKSRAELRFYFTDFRREYESLFFLAFEGFHINYKYSTKNQSYVSSDGTSYGYEFARTTKTVEGFALKIGCVLRFKFPIWIELYGGPGVRYVNVVYSDFVNKGPDVFPALTSLFSDFDGSREGKFTKFHLALGAKISYRL